MLDVLVVGAGLFGQVVADNLKSLGMSVVVVDAGRPDAGSRPGGGLMYPTKFRSLGKEAYGPALGVLDKLYSVEDVRLKSPRGTTTVHWCNPRSILRGGPMAHQDVKEVGPGWADTGRERFEARTVVVAAGVWTGQLVPVPGLVPRAGASFLWPGRHVQHPFMKGKVTAFNRGDGLWAYDGAALRPQAYDGARMTKSMNLCAAAAGVHLHADGPQVLHGRVPHVPDTAGNPCYLKVAPGLVVTTGGAKHGVLAAGWCAHKVAEALS